MERRPRRLRITQQTVSKFRSSQAIDANRTKIDASLRSETSFGEEVDKWAVSAMVLAALGRKRSRLADSRDDARGSSRKW